MIEEFKEYIRLMSVFCLLVGALECFAGLKIMKVMMSIWGFLIGMSLGVVAGIAFNSYAVVIVIGSALGAALAVITYKIYLVGIFSIVSSLVGIAVYILSQSVFLSVVIGLVIGVASLFCINPVVVLSTAFAGAGLIVRSAYMLMDVSFEDSKIVAIILWLFITAAGAYCQLVTISKAYEFDSLPMRRSALRESPTPSELKYPGMQRSYRNYCIRCGTRLEDKKTKCRCCGFEYNKN